MQKLQSLRDDTNAAMSSRSPRESVEGPRSNTSASALSGAALGTPITPEIVARVLAHPEGGRKGVPAGARVVALINKVERLPDRTPARETAERLLREPAIESVLLTTLRGEEPVLELCAR